MNTKISFKKKIIVLLLLSLMYYSVCFGYQNVVNYAPKYATLTSNSNLRVGPSTSYNSLKVLNSGTIVKIVGEINDFYIVQTDGNQVGMIKKDLLKTTTTPPASGSTYTSLTPQIVTITDSVVNVRSGPSTSFLTIAKVYNGQKVKVIGEIDDFYLVVTADNKVGMIKKDLLNLGNSGSGNLELTTEEKTVLYLLNNERRKNNLPEFTIFDKLEEIARLKSNDMVKNNYFSHTSPTYGSPFDMMKNYGITYRAAGENIAGNKSLENAVASWMNSETHKENILSNNYNYVGIGVTPSDKYGYVVTVMFIGK